MVFSFFASVADELHSACAMFSVQVVPCLMPCLILAVSNFGQAFKGFIVNGDGQRSPVRIKSIKFMYALLQVLISSKYCINMIIYVIYIIHIVYLPTLFMQC